MAPVSSVIPLLLATGVALGLGVPISKAAGAYDVHPFAFVTWPTLIAGLAFGLLAWRRQPAPQDPMRLLRFGAVAGLLGHAAPMSALFWLTAEAGAGFAALAFTLPPVFTLAIAILVRVQQPSGRRLLAVGIGLAGALLLAWGRSGSLGGAGWPLLLVLAVPALIGAANVYRSLHMPPGVAGVWLAAATLLGSSVVLLLAGCVLPGLAIPERPEALGWLGLQAVLLMLGYQLYFALQRRAEPVTFSFMGYVSMLTGVLAGTLVFGERLHWSTGPAALLILAALVLLRTPAPARGAGTLSRTLSRTRSRTSSRTPAVQP